MLSGTGWMFSPIQRANYICAPGVYSYTMCIYAYAEIGMRLCLLYKMCCQKESGKPGRKGEGETCSLFWARGPPPPFSARNQPWNSERRKNWCECPQQVQSPPSLPQGSPQNVPKHQIGGERASKWEGAISRQSQTLVSFAWEIKLGRVAGLYYPLQQKPASQWQFFWERTYLHMGKKSKQ